MCYCLNRLKVLFGRKLLTSGENRIAKAYKTDVSEKKWDFNAQTGRRGFST